jgi:hypothetical protein
MTEHQKTYKGITYSVTQRVIDDMKKKHELDVFDEIENMLDREIEIGAKNDKL